MPASKTIDLFNYDVPDGGVDDEDWEDLKRAKEILESEMSNGSLFINDGRRNNTAVNTCIALHIWHLDPVVWYENFFADMQTGVKMFHDMDVDAFMEHVERVAPYLVEWGPDGARWQALNFML